ncbi:MAG: HAMP domain-containing histidine kinase [Actinomycetota bacterium]|nr:HAMP domain-containing histidine kinase [Actinomycetota bacterium]
MSLRARMGLAAGVAVAIAVIAVAISAYAGTRSELLSQTDQSLRKIANPVLTGGPARAEAARAARKPLGLFGARSSAVVPMGSPQAIDLAGRCGRGPGDFDEGLGIDHPPQQAFGGPPGSFTLVCHNGLTYSPSGQRIPVDATARALAASGHGQYVTSEEAAGHHIRVLATGLGWRGALLVALPYDNVESALASERLLLVLIAAGGIALAVLLGVLVARAAVAPIVRFTRQTETIAARPDRIEHQRVEVTGSDELARLARTFNSTLEALERSVAAQRSLVADASHELRTPIATIRANIQMLRDADRLSRADREALRADVIDELDELTALVSDVVELARGTKAAGESGDVRLDEIVAGALDRARRRAPQLSVHASLEPTIVRGEGDRIARAVSNLLDNAAKWSPDGGVIDVELNGGVLAVRDRGPGFHEDDLPFVFDRFHRARDARAKPGSGLGLAIAKQAAEAHGGFVEAGNAPGGGAILRIGFGEHFAPAREEPSTVEAR